MEFNSSVNMINEQASEYQQLVIVLIVVASIFGIAAIVIWFVFDIGHSIKVVTGMGVGREIKKIKEDTKEGKGAKSNGNYKTVTNWSTSGLLKRSDSTDFGEKTAVLESLEECEETVVLENKNPSEAFVIEEEIKLTGTNEKL